MPASAHSTALLCGTPVLGGGAGVGTSATALPLTLGVDMWFSPNYLHECWIESPQGIAETHPSADGHSVGQLDSLGAWAGFMVAGTAGTGGTQDQITGSDSARGTLASTGRNTAIARTTSHQYTIDRSRKAFRYMWVEKVCTLVMFVKFGADGATAILFDNIKGSAATDSSTAAGWYLAKTSGNILQLLVANGAGGLMVNTSTTGKTVLASHGWVMIVVTLNGHGSSLGKIRAYSCQTGEQLWAEHTFNTNGATAAAAGTNATRQIGIGGYSDGTTTTQRFVGDMADIMTWSSVVSDANLSLLARFNPSRTASNQARALVAGSSLAPTDLSGCLMWFDFRTAGTWNFQERTSPTTPAATGQPLGYSYNRVGERMHRDLIAQSDAERPIWTSNVFGASLGAISFEGSDAERMDFPTLLKAGNVSLMIVGRQNDTVNGSQVIRSPSGSIYATQTCSDYETPGDVYFILHDPECYYGVQGGVGQTAYNGEALHAWMLRMYGASAMAGVGGQWGDVVTTPGSVHNFDRLGASASHDLDFDPDMEIVAVCVWVGLHSQANLRKVMQYFIDGGLAITEL